MARVAVRAKEGYHRAGQPGFEQIGSPRVIETYRQAKLVNKVGIIVQICPQRSGQSGDYTLDTLPNGVLSGDEASLKQVVQ